MKANLVLIQSIWRRERNNLNAARAGRGRGTEGEGEQSLSCALILCPEGPTQSVRQALGFFRQPPSLNEHDSTLRTLQMTAALRTRISAMPVPSCPHRLTSFIRPTITTGSSSSSNNNHSRITAATMVPAAAAAVAGSSTITRLRRRPLRPLPLAWRLTT